MDSAAPSVLAWSVPDAARRIGVSRNTLDRLRDRGEIAYTRIGTRCVVTEAELCRFLTAQTATPVAS